MRKTPSRGYALLFTGTLFVGMFAGAGFELAARKTRAFRVASASLPAARSDARSIEAPELVAKASAPVAAR